MQTKIRSFKTKPFKTNVNCYSYWKSLKSMIISSCILLSLQWIQRGKIIMITKSCKFHQKLLSEFMQSKVLSIRLQTGFPNYQLYFSANAYHVMHLITTLSFEKIPKFHPHPPPLLGNLFSPFQNVQKVTIKHI